MLIAVAFWSYTQYLRFKEVRISVPVSYVNRPAQLLYASETKRFIKITVRGDEEDIKFPTGNLKAQVDLRSARAGKSSYPIAFDIRQLPEKIDLVKIDDQVSLVLEKSVQKYLNIRPVIAGRPAAGYKRGRVTVSPEKVLFVGANSKLKGINSVKTAPIDISGASSTVTRVANLAFNENYLRQAGKDQITVNITIFSPAKPSEVASKKVAIRTQNLDPALQALLSTRSVTVQVQADEDTLKRITERDLEAYVDLEGTSFNPKTGKILPYANEPGMQIRVNLLRYKGRARILNVAPPSLTVRFNIKEEFIKKPLKEEVNNE